MPTRSPPLEGKHEREDEEERVHQKKAHRQADVNVSHEATVQRPGSVTAGTNGHAEDQKCLATEVADFPPCQPAPFTFGFSPL